MSWHLTANHYPPLGEYTDELVATIVGLNDGSITLDDAVNLGTDHTMIPSLAWASTEGWMVNAADFVNATHAWSFLEV